MKFVNKKTGDYTPVIIYFANPTALVSLTTVTLICPGYCIPSSIFLATSLDITLASSSFNWSEFTIILNSLPACIANDESTPSNEFAIVSSCSNLFKYVDNVSLLAPGLDAEIASAACTRTDSTDSNSTSLWWAPTAFNTKGLIVSLK